MIEDYKQVASSFRDPSGFVFTRDGSLYRQINRNYQKNYQHLIKSGLYDRLTGDRLLISHTEQGPGQGVTEEVYQVIKPEPISFVSYPYEWCFSQLKHAALLTLDIQMKALEYGMSLKDCSAYNVQFEAGKSIFIDPDGRVLQTSGAAEEAILTEIIDFNHVKRTRRMGTLGLCHPLRELQNAPLNFPCYTEGLSKGKFFEK